MSRLSRSSILLMQTTTWTKDSYGLFDYESHDIIKKELNITNNSSLIKIGNNLHIINCEDEKLYSNSKILASIHNQNDSYTITKSIKKKNLNHEINSQNLWLVIKTFTKPYGKGLYRLEIGDIIRMGRSIYRVRDIAITSGNSMSGISSTPRQYEDKYIDLRFQMKKCSNFYNPSKLKSIEEKSPKNSSKPACRICLTDEELDSENTLNYLVSPCRCSGTLKYVHIKCLQDWIMSKRDIIIESDCAIYLWKSSECELCNQEFPDLFTIEGQYIDLFKMPLSIMDYMILEDLNKDPEFNKKYYVIQHQPNKITSIGRGKLNSVRSDDFSVSRIHSVIKADNNHFYLADNGSRYGTVVLLRDDGLKINQNNNNPWLQIGSTIISFSVKKKDKEIQIPPKKSIIIDLLNDEKYNSDENRKKNSNFQDDDLKMSWMRIEEIELIINKKQRKLETNSVNFNA